MISIKTKKENITPKTGMKRKRLSKNKKKSWKHSDVKDVEEHLDDVRFEERIGWSATGKADDSLFFVDKTQIDKRRPAKTAVKEAKAKYYRHLEPSQFPEPVTKPRRARKPPSEEKAKELDKQLLAKRAKRKARLREVPKEVPKAKQHWAPEYDMWGGANQQDDGYVKDMIEFHDSQTRNKKIQVPKIRYQKSSKLPAVEVPHPGSSYNPVYEDYQDLVSKANVIEERKKKEEEHLDRVLTKMFPTKAQAPTQESWIVEMSQGLQIETAPPESETDSEDEMDAEILPNPTIRAERKLSSKRRREERQKATEKELQKSKEFRMQQNEVYRLKNITSEIKQREMLTKKRIQEREKKQEEKLYQPATLSKYKYEAPDLEVCTISELSGSLRTIKKQGSLPVDRLKSLQRRNIIEPRIKQLRKRKYKLKRLIKRGHKIEDMEKDDKLSTRIGSWDKRQNDYMGAKNAKIMRRMQPKKTGRKTKKTVTTKTLK